MGLPLSATTPVSPSGKVVFSRHDLTELDRREVYLWVVLGRFQEAQSRGDAAGAARLELAFKKRLVEYQTACDEELHHG